MSRKTILLLVCLSFVRAASSYAEDAKEGVEFFEKRIRPVLVEHCYQCHSSESKSPKGGLLLDTRHKVLAYEPLFRGTIDGASVYPRVVVQRALAANAAAVIFAHQHPSGNSEPSAADRAITRRLKDALDLIDIRVLDHFIIGEGRPYSFAENGLL